MDENDMSESAKVEVTGKDGKPIEHEHSHQVIQAIVDAVDGADTGVGPARSRRP